MFERFLGCYSPDEGRAPQTPVWDEPTLMQVPGYAFLAPKIAGLSLGGGLLWFLGKDDGPRMQRVVADAFPEFANRAVPFARDWLGRVFAIDRERMAGSVLQLLLLEPGSGDAFDIDEGFVDFLNMALVDDQDTYLESDLFEEWRASGGKVPHADQCVGFKLPLFLGGSGSISNLEVSDLEVYWGLNGQMRLGVKNLPTGTKIEGIQLQ